jgi:uncharacterized protein (UPF0332 family)
MDAPRFLDFADRLVAAVKSRSGLGLDSGIAECRSAVSRAYYSAFHVAREYLEEIGFVLAERGSCHKALQFALKASGHGGIAAIGSQLDTLYTERLSADYDLAISRTEKIGQVEALVKDSRMLLRLIATLRSGQNNPPVDLSRVASAIEAKKLTESWGKDVRKK